MGEAVGLWIRTRGVLAEIFGQVATIDFWKQLARDMVQQMFAAFLMTLGGTLAFYGKKRLNKEMQATTEPESGAAARAFGGFHPSASFTPSGAYPVPPAPSGDARFPGFR
jgi:hypothetical protein